VLLASLLASGRWHHPGDDVLHRALRAERRLRAQMQPERARWMRPPIIQFWLAG
jgi:hypothetical protein